MFYGQNNSCNNYYVYLKFLTQPFQGFFIKIPYRLCSELKELDKPLFVPLNLS